MGLIKGSSIGLEIEQDQISVVELDKPHGKEIILKKYGRIELQPSFITPSLNTENILDAEGIKQAIKTLFDNADIKGREISVAIPDASIKIAFLEFEDLPKDKQKGIDLIKWNLKKTFPFPADEAAVEFQTLDTPSEGNHFYRLIAVIIKKVVLEQYEKILNSCHLFPVRIVPSSFAVYNLYHNYLLQTPIYVILTVSQKRITFMAVRDGKPCFHRSKAINDEKDVLREILISFSSYQDIYRDMPATVYLVICDSNLEGLKVDMEKHSIMGIKTIGLTDIIKGGRSSMNAFSSAAGAAL